MKKNIKKSNRPRAKKIDALIGYVLGSVIGTLIVLLVGAIIIGMPSKPDRLKDLVSQARIRDYGTVCDHDNSGEYCVVAYSEHYPKVMVDFDDCLQEARMLPEKGRREARAEWCSCMADSHGADMGVALYRCGTGWYFKVRKVEPNG